MTQPSQKKPRCTFTPEFKLDIVRHANTPKASISSIALEHDINANQVFRWIHEVKQNKVRWVFLATRVSNPIALQQALSPTFLPVTVRETQTPDKPLITPNDGHWQPLSSPMAIVCSCIKVMLSCSSS
jgi:transposase-like protein